MNKIVTLDAACRQCFLDMVDRLGEKHLPAAELDRLRAQVDELMAAAPPGSVAPMVARQVTDLVSAALGIEDPFIAPKQVANEHAAAVLDDLRALIDKADDPFAAAVRIALAGNVIDFVYRGSHDLLTVAKRLLAEPLGIDAIDELRAELVDARTVLVLGDNVGETWCDRLLLERFPSHLDVTYAVRSAPILNDVTLPDARIAGLDRVARVLPSGSDAPGTLLDKLTPEMRERFAVADVVLSKGQGNFESLYGRAARPLYFMFLVKCEHVAGIIGQPVGKGIIWRWTPAAD